MHCNPTPPTDDIIDNRLTHTDIGRTIHPGVPAIIITYEQVPARLDPRDHDRYDVPPMLTTEYDRQHTGRLEKLVRRDVDDV